MEEHVLRAAFDATRPLTIGLEEEVLLLDPRAHEPLPVAAEVVHAAADPKVKRELPACQVELITEPRPDVAGAIAELTAARDVLRRVCGDALAPAAAAVHPTCAATTSTSATDRHQDITHAYGDIARQQLVGALQVHVALGSADRTLPVYNALRGYLPEIAALAAAAPFHEGKDTGLASIRPVIAAQLPRQGVPPAIASWADLAADLRWGATSGTVPEPRRWWWELRPHALHGTLEVRVPDVQATIEASAAVVGTVHALVSWLSEQHDDGRTLPVPATWRVAENRWSALRDGVHGTLADLDSGTPMRTADRLHALLDQIEAHAPDGLDDARSLIRRNGADELRDAGIGRAAASLAERF
jgi:carboxylate-amine ligase